MTIFLRVIEESIDRKQDALLAAVRNSGGGTRFEINTEDLRRLPKSPFSYWISDSIRELFKRVPPLERVGIEARVGDHPGDGFRYLRLAWEVKRNGALVWIDYQKGGSYSPYYSDLHLVANWDHDRRTYRGFLGRPGRGNERPSNFEYFMCPGICWPLRTNGLSVRAMPAGCVFSHKGPTIFVDADSEALLLRCLSIVNSSTFEYLVRSQLARTELAQSYEVGLIQQTPLPDLELHTSAQLATLARRAWSLRRRLDAEIETSHAFSLPRQLYERASGGSRALWEAELLDIQDEIDEAAFALYGINPQDRAAIERSLARVRSSESSDPSEGDEAHGDDEDAGEDIAPAGQSSSALVSWLVGVAFCRFDPRLATGERPLSGEPEPFDPLPVRSPGMYPEDEEPDERPDILVDDEGHADDLIARAVAIAERVKVDTPENLRGWLAKEFFPLHIKMYSKSRRKAPIYWQLATPTASYSVWLYINAFSKDTLFRVQNEYAVPKLAHEERRLEVLTSELRNGATAAQRKQLAAQETLVEELRTFLDEVKRIAPLWKPNLDDGVVINFAPLWRLVPQNKPWQKELKSTWDALCGGKYDWAHLAMHLWPERVVPKCAKDRSLAIAHGLEDVFWIEQADGKWTARTTPTKAVDELVQERTSPAVKASLRSLLEAPVAGSKSTGRNSGGRRGAASVAEVGDA